MAELYDTPLLELVFAAARVHRMHHDPRQASCVVAFFVLVLPLSSLVPRLQRPSPHALQVQQCTLMSIKTGGCPEDCGYCSQSTSASGTGVTATKLADLDEVYAAAVRAKEAGSTRFCMGAAWRGPSQVGPRQFGRVLEMTSKIKELGMEARAAGQGGKDLCLDVSNPRRFEPALPRCAPRWAC